MTGTAGDERRLTRDPRLWRVIIAASIGVFAIELDFFAVQAALPDMARDLGTSVTTLQWVISGYMLANGATLIVGGRIGDPDGPAVGGPFAADEQPGRHVDARQGGKVNGHASSNVSRTVCVIRATDGST